jgi:hypothetical protein
MEMPLELQPETSADHADADLFGGGAGARDGGDRRGRMHESAARER